MKNRLASMTAAALVALACLAGAAKAEGSYSSATGGQLIGLSSMSGSVQGGFMDGRTRASVGSMDYGDGSQSSPCDRYDGEEYAACTDGYNGYGCSSWDGDNWWACQYGQTAQQSGGSDSSSYSSGGGGGGAVDPVSGSLFASFALVGAAAKRRRKS